MINLKMSQLFNLHYSYVCLFVTSFRP